MLSKDKNFVITLYDNKSFSDLDQLDIQHVVKGQKNLSFFILSFFSKLNGQFQNRHSLNSQLKSNGIHKETVVS